MLVIKTTPVLFPSSLGEMLVLLHLLIYSVKVPDDVDPHSGSSRYVRVGAAVVCVLRSAYDPLTSSKSSVRAESFILRIRKDMWLLKYERDGMHRCIANRKASCTSTALAVSTSIISSTQQCSSSAPYVYESKAQVFVCAQSGS